MRLHKIRLSFLFLLVIIFIPNNSRGQFDDYSPSLYAALSSYISPEDKPRPKDTDVESSSPVTYPGSPPDLATYIAHAGDTLDIIAQKFGITVKEILKFNKIENPDNIPEGQEIIIPAREDSASNTPVTSGVSKDYPGSYSSQTITYVVQPGDTWNSIAQKFGTTVAELALINLIDDPNSIQVGKSINVPKGNQSVSNLPVASDRPVTTPESPSESSSIYIVQAGDTLSIIAQKYGITADELARANNINNSDSLSEGQIINIPTTNRNVVNSPASSDVSDTSSSSATEWSTYIIQAGDTLSDIAGRFGTTVEELLRINNIANSDNIREGQSISVPTRDQSMPNLPVTSDMPVTSSEKPSDWRIYVVQAGDTLAAIAQKFGTIVDELSKANNFNNPDNLQEGQSIFIPGREKTVDNTSTPPELSSSPIEWNTYIVQAGDTLSDIAQRFETTVEELLGANSIIDPDSIQEGQSIKIPTRSQSIKNTPVTSDRPVTPSESTSAPSFTYIVQAGDTLSSIAEQYGTTVEELARVNSIENPDKIEVGDSIMIPAGDQSMPNLPVTSDMPVTSPGSPSDLSTYIVQAEETLAAIAQKFETTIEEILKINNIDNPDNIQEGQTITLPTGDQSVSNTPVTSEAPATSTELP